MKKVAIIGSSHLGALKQAFSKFSKDKTLLFDTVFWGVPGQHFLFPSMRYEMGKVISPNWRFSSIVSEGRYNDDLPLSDFDFVVFYGGICISSVAQVVPWILREKKYSSKFMEEAASDIIAKKISDSIASRIISQIPKAVFPEKLIICSCPLYARSRNNFPDVKKGKVFVDLTEILLKNHFESLGCAYVSQPESTVQDGVYTNQIFKKDSIKLDLGVPHGDDDYTHMNSLYGELILDKIFKSLQS